MEYYDFFIVRVWRRDGADGEQWTGRLERLQGQDSWRFGDADALLAYLHGLIGPRPITIGEDGYQSPARRLDMPLAPAPLPKAPVVGDRADGAIYHVRDIHA